MKKANITRREFIKKSTATVASTAVLPAALAETTDAAAKPKLPRARPRAAPAFRRRSWPLAAGVAS